MVTADDNSRKWQGAGADISYRPPPYHAGTQRMNDAIVELVDATSSFIYVYKVDRNATIDDVLKAIRTRMYEPWA